MQLPGKARAANRRFLEALHGLRRGPFMEMFEDKGAYMLIREAMHLLERDQMIEVTDESVTVSSPSKKVIDKDQN